MDLIVNAISAKIIKWIAGCFLSVPGIMLAIVLLFLMVLSGGTSPNMPLEEFQLISQEYSQQHIEYFNETGVYVPVGRSLAVDFLLTEGTYNEYSTDSVEQYLEASTETAKDGSKALNTDEEYTKNIWEMSLPFPQQFDNLEEFNSYLIPEINYLNSLVGGEVASVDGFAFPVQNYSVTALFGYYDPFDDGNINFHNGTDFTGSPEVYASADGTVIDVSNKCSEGDYECGHGFGNYIVIETVINGETYTTMYGHLSQVNVSAGQNIKQGDVIGIMGNTGHSNGTHLHFEIHAGSNVFDHASGEKSPSAIDPLTILKEGE